MQAKCSTQWTGWIHNIPGRGDWSFLRKTVGIWVPLSGRSGSRDLDGDIQRQADAAGIRTLSFKLPDSVLWMSTWIVPLGKVLRCGGWKPVLLSPQSSSSQLYNNSLDSQVKCFSSIRVFDLACQRHIGLRHLLSPLLVVSSYSVSSELHVPSHLDDCLKMLPRHFPYCIMCRVLPLSGGNENAQLKETQMVNKIDGNLAVCAIYLSPSEETSLNKKRTPWKALHIIHLK